MPGVEIHGLSVEPYPLVRETAKNELTLYMWESAGRFAGAIAYSRDLFEERTAALLGRKLLAVLELATARPEIPLRELDAALRELDRRDRMEREQDLRKTRRGDLAALRRSRPSRTSPERHYQSEEESHS